MAAAPPLFDFALFDENKPLFTIDDIRECNPQRFEMEQLTGILHVDHEAKGLVGYKDITPNEFWVSVAWMRSAFGHRSWSASDSSSWPNSTGCGPSSGPSSIFKAS